MRNFNYICIEKENNSCKYIKDKTSVWTSMLKILNIWPEDSENLEKSLTVFDGCPVVSVNQKPTFLVLHSSVALLYINSYVMEVKSSFGDQIVDVSDCEHVCFCSEVGHLNMEVSSELVARP